MTEKTTRWESVKWGFFKDGETIRATHITSGAQVVGVAENTEAWSQDSFKIGGIEIRNLDSYTFERERPANDLPTKPGRYATDSGQVLVLGENGLWTSPDGKRIDDLDRVRALGKLHYLVRSDEIIKFAAENATEKVIGLLNLDQKGSAVKTVRKLRGRIFK